MPRISIGRPKFIRSVCAGRHKIAGFPVLNALDGAGKVISAWILPAGNPTQFLTLSGTDVTQWTASHGTFKADMIQSVPNAPAYNSAAFSGKGGVEFTGASTMFLNSEGGNVASWPNRDIDTWILSAVRQDALVADTTQRVILSYGQSQLIERLIGRDVHSSNGTNAAMMFASDVNSFIEGVTVCAGAHTIGAFFNPTNGGGETGFVYLDGVQDATDFININSMTRTRARIGAPVSGIGAWKGAVAAVALLNDTATPANFTALEAEFRARIV